MTETIVSCVVSEETKVSNDVTSDITDDDDTCPIGLVKFTKPVLTVAGQMYEKVYIEDWFREHDTDPLTGMWVGSYKQLIPVPESVFKNEKELTELKNKTRENTLIWAPTLGFLHRATLLTKHIEDYKMKINKNSFTEDEKKDWNLYNLKINKMTKQFLKPTAVIIKQKVRPVYRPLYEDYQEDEEEQYREPEREPEPESLPELEEEEPPKKVETKSEVKSVGKGPAPKKGTPKVAKKKDDVVKKAKKKKVTAKKKQLTQTPPTGKYSSYKEALEQSGKEKEDELHLNDLYNQWRTQTLLEELYDEKKPKAKLEVKPEVKVQPKLEVKPEVKVEAKVEVIKEVVKVCTTIEHISEECTMNCMERFYVKLIKNTLLFGFRFAQLKSMRIVNQMFKDFPFDGADLFNTHFENCVMTHCSFNGTDLKSTHFHSCNMRGDGVMFVGAIADQETTFEYCSLEYMNVWQCATEEKEFRRILDKRGLENANRVTIYL